MEQKLKIAVFIDFDNIEIGVKSTLHREFDVADAPSPSLQLDVLLPERPHVLLDPCLGGPKVLESDESTTVRNPDQNGFALGLME